MVDSKVEAEAEAFKDAGNAAFKSELLVRNFLRSLSFSLI